MTQPEYQLALSAQETKFISDSFGMSLTQDPHKTKVETALFSWAESVLSEKQLVLIRSLCSDASNQRLIPRGMLLFALEEPAAAEPDAINITFGRSELEYIRPRVSRHMSFVELMMQRDRMHLINNYTDPSLDLDAEDEELKLGVLASQTRFEAQQKLGENVLLLIDSNLKS